MNASNEVSKHAHLLHKRAIVIDGHADILIPMTEGKMRLGDRVEVPDPASWIAPQSSYL